VSFPEGPAGPIDGDPKWASADVPGPDPTGIPADGPVDHLLAAIDELLPDWLGWSTVEAITTPEVGEELASATEPAPAGPAPVEPEGELDASAGTHVDAAVGFGLVAVVAIRLRESAARRARRARRHSLGASDWPSSAGAPVSARG
jgi:hypothetical protein